MKRNGLRAAVVLIAVCGVAHGATFTVTNAADSGIGTLRDAISNANMTVGTDIIGFNIPTVPPYSLATIALTNPLPPITDPVVIDGSTQTSNTCPPGVELDGAAVPFMIGAHGLTILTDSCGIKCLVINRFPLNGIYINNAFGQNRVEGCYIGTDTNGTAALGNGLNGIMIENSPTNHIGDTPLTNCARRNIISGNGRNGIYITGTLSIDNKMQNNRIGTDVSGLDPIANGWNGVLVDGGWGNDVGSTAGPKPVNVISGNRTNGVVIATPASVNYILGNHIGVTWSGYTALGNGEDGVLIVDSGGNWVGDNSGEARNTIAGNGDDGVELRDTASIGNMVRGNYIGISTNGLGPLPNQDDGVVITNNCTQNQIGGTTIHEKNLISGNKGCGVKLDGGAFGNFIYGNYIGVNRDGLGAVSNGEHGVLIVNRSQGNSIGSSFGPSYGNLISGNGATDVYHGVCIAAGAYGMTVAGNIIGLGANNMPVPNAGDGIRIENAGTNTIGWQAYGRNVISGNARNGIRIGANADRNYIYGNYIGLDTNGASARGNGNEGVYIYRSAYNEIGDTNAGFGNVISGNAGSGILIGDNASARDNEIINNFIGTDLTGGNRIGNSDHGVHVLGGVSNWVGGEMGGGNVIAGNDLDGVRIQDSAAMYNKVYRNLVGVDASGMAPLGNGQYGVSVFSASRTAIGESGGRGNVIGGNADDGVHISGSAAFGNTLHANKIGTDATFTYVLSNRLNGVWIGANASGNSVGGDNVSYINHIWNNGGCGVRVVSGTNNTILGNSFYSNALLGIDIGPLGVTANDVQDPDAGANFLQNYPVLYEATTGSVRIAGCLNAVPLTEYWLEFYRVAPYDAGTSTHGEGYNPMYATNLTTDASGNVAFEVVSTVTYPAGDQVTATATDPFGNTSEFAANVAIVPTNLYGDADGDGMPTRWEVPNHLDPYDPTGTNGAAGDPDGDGIPNLDEYVADTDPSDPGNYFHFTAIVQTGSTIVTYTSTNTRYYVVSSCADPLDGAGWSDVHPLPVAGSNGATSASDAAGPTVRVYRAQVRLIP